MKIVNHSVTDSVFFFQISISDKLKQSDNAEVLDFASHVETVFAKSSCYSWKRLARYFFFINFFALKKFVIHVVPFPRNITDILLITSMMTMTVTFASFIAINLEEILTSPPFQMEISYRGCVGLTLAVTLVLCSIRELANLSWVMVVAGVCEFYIIAVIYYFAFAKVANDPDTAAANGKRYLFTSWAQVPITFSMRKWSKATY